MSEVQPKAPEGLGLFTTSVPIAMVDGNIHIDKEAQDAALFELRRQAEEAGYDIARLNVNCFVHVDQMLGVYVGTVFARKA